MPAPDWFDRTSAPVPYGGLGPPPQIDRGGSGAFLGDVEVDRREDAVVCRLFTYLVSSSPETAA